MSGVVLICNMLLFIFTHPFFKYIVKWMVALQDIFFPTNIALI